MIQIFTDTSANLPAAYIQKYSLRVIPLHYSINGVQAQQDPTVDFDGKAYYDAMRSGAPVSTAMINLAAFLEPLHEALADGNDVIYIGMSGGISGTAHAAAMAVEELQEEFPERKIAPGANVPRAPAFFICLFVSAASGSLALRAQPAARHAGEIRDDALAAPAVQLLQTGHVVDGPDVHLHAVLLAVAHVFVREQLDRRVVAGETRLLTVVAGEAADAVLEHERADLDRVAADLEDAAQREVVER